ncbi:hypothetical protein [Bhargavaea cecembensis]|uniref:hypothetical protein n=1 Tax=Bhargavaea cecembensis TaxID=394098 RepID=UPI00058C91FA|nr:hypothetical protein [Bhargavaea cecembensis]
MFELIAALLEAIPDLWPSKKNRLVNRRLKLLKETSVYDGLNDRYGPLVLSSRRFRDFLYLEKVESFSGDWGKMEAFLYRLDAFVKKENL